MNIPIQETAGEIEKVEKEEEDTQERSCVSPSSFLSYIGIFKERQETGRAYSGRRGGGPQSLAHFSPVPV